MNLPLTSLAVLALAVAANAAGVAQEPAAAAAAAPAVLSARPLKIGYLDLTRVLKDYHRRQDLEAEFRELGTSLTRDDQSRKAEIDKYDSEIEQLAMGTPERLALEDKRKAALKQIEESRRAAQQKIAQRYVTAINQLYDDIRGVVSELGKEGDFDLIIKDQSTEAQTAAVTDPALQISRQVVLYSRPEYDLTSVVTQRVNDRYAEQVKKSEPAKDPKKPADPPAKER